MTADVVKFKFRLVLLGSHGTGFLFKKFETKYKPTVEDLFTKSFDLGSIEIEVDFLDTSGSMQFPAMRRLSITTGSAFLIVYAVDDESSYEVLKMCMKEIQEIRPDFQEVPIVFAGNKCDIPRERRKVLKEVVSNYVHYDLPRLRAKVIECSCRDSININNLFKSYLSLAKVSIPSSPITATNSSSVAGGGGGGGGGGAAHRSSQHHLHQRQLVASSHHEQGGSGGASRHNDGDDDDGELTGNTGATNSRRSSSMKDALGVRKSCDASILNPNRRKTSQAASQTCPSPGASGGCAGGKGNGNGSGSNASKEGTAQGETEEVNLEQAIQSKLNVSQTSHKPRSKSLIWRPQRKSRAAVEQSDCRLT